MPLYKVVNGNRVAMTAAEEAEFTTPQPATVPQAVTRAQLKLALLAGGRLDAAEAALQAATRERKVVWADRDTFNRDSTFVAQLATALSLTTAQVDDLFKQAGTL